MRRSICVLLSLVIMACLPACGKPKLNLQSEKAAIDYLENYMYEDGWNDVANKFNLYYTVVGSKEIDDTSFASLEDDVWLVVLHGSVAGYTDINQTNYKAIQYSYAAQVTMDGTVNVLLIQEGKITGISLDKGE